MTRPPPPAALNMTTPSFIRHSCRYINHMIAASLNMCCFFNGHMETLFAEADGSKICHQSKSCQLSCGVGGTYSSYCGD